LPIYTLFLGTGCPLGPPSTLQTDTLSIPSPGSCASYPSSKNQQTRFLFDHPPLRGGLPQERFIPDRHHPCGPDGHFFLISFLSCDHPKDSSTLGPREVSVYREIDLGPSLRPHFGLTCAFFPTFGSIVIFFRHGSPRSSRLASLTIPICNKSGNSYFCVLPSPLFPPQSPPRHCFYPPLAWLLVGATTDQGLNCLLFFCAPSQTLRTI